MCGCWSENVSSMEGSGDSRKHVYWVANSVDVTYPLPLRRQHKETVIGSHVEATSSFNHQRPSLGSDPRVHNRHMNRALGKIWCRGGEHKGACAYVKLFNLMAYVHNTRFGAD